ncbi:aryl-sulfate sulfotransferase [candidate division KSB1 bacterium]|nr:aryl-sulfate sulfotransferase [candidate division KSB1 bacterium]
MALICAVPLFGNQLQGYQYLSPKPNAKYVSPQSPILFRFQDEFPLNMINLSSCLNVYGSQAGEYSCRIYLASDNRTVICKPVRPFHLGETVTVRIKPEFESLHSRTTSFQYIFYVSESMSATNTIDSQRADPNHASISSTSDSPSSGTFRQLPNGVSVPANFPEYKVLVSDNPYQDHLFLSATGKENFLLILDNQGYPFWYLKTPYPRYDFKVHSNKMMTMYVQKEEGYSFGNGFIGLDTTFTLVDSFYADYGYDTDYHDLKLLESGNYLLIGTREEQVNLSEYVTGGHPTASVCHSVIQEFTEQGELIFLWRAWDYFDIADMVIEDWSMPSLRFPHINAVDIDEDGHILISSRHLGEVTKINRQTGGIIWRLGGAHNQFTFVDDPLNGFSGQHDIRSLGDGRYMVFDNGNLHQPPVSRAIEYELDTENKTATLVWQFRDTPDKYASWMGNAQRLANGNTLVNWAKSHLPKPTEVNPLGEKVFEMVFENPLTCYRIYRFDWHGMARKPYLIVEPYDNQITLLFNKFGDSNVDYYNIYADQTPHPTAVVDTCKQTLKNLYDFENKQNYYFRVTAVNQDGHESPFSNEECVFVNFCTAGENMVSNAEFGDGLHYWNFAVNGCAKSTGAVNSDGQFHFDIQNGGEDFHNIQLSQGKLRLVKGRDYRFEFDARSDKDRMIEAYITKEGETSRNFGKIGPTLLSERMQHFVYSFTMNAPTDFKAVVIFSVGGSNGDVTIDNVSLKQPIESSVPNSEYSANNFEWIQIYPNPFNQETKITYQLFDPSHVTVFLYNSNGRLIRPLVQTLQQVGFHHVSWDSRDQSGVPAASGIYFCQLNIKNNSVLFTKTIKITLLK